VSINQEIIFDEKLIKKYDKAGPRYTSYPTAIEFDQQFTLDSYKNLCTISNSYYRPLSLYFHIPFCDTVCYYCGCNKIVTKNRSRAEPYLKRLHKEIAMQGKLFDKDKVVQQLHWGGGTPTFISHNEMRDLMAETAKHFHLLDDDSGEYSIELDPREVSDETMRVLREIGFNRVSLGVQDFNPEVQKAVNRIQSTQQTRSVIEQARKLKFKSISIDLIYGLPHQTLESFDKTLDKVIELSPDRLSIYNYAHMPHLFKPQRRISQEDLPTPQEKLAIFKQTIDKLTCHGYVYIGMDHFAKYDDELAVAQRNGDLQRNFQGYSTHANTDMVSMGVTSISQIGHSFSQNVKTEDDYFELIDSNNFPMMRGLELKGDDILRQEVISELICHFQLNTIIISKIYGIDFWKYFKQEWHDLEVMQKDGLLTLDEHSIHVTPKGKLLIRNICMVFDIYLRQKQHSQRFSKTI
jgi:oxygen-independent coproporphyrinogen-3 oxidase